MHPRHFPFAAALSLTLSLTMVATASPASGQDYPSIAFNGRIQADHTRYFNDGYPYADGSEVRRMRLRVGGELSARWSFRVQYDFAPDTPAERDVYLRYDSGNQRITAGNFKVFSGLEELISSNNNTFAERSVANALDTGRRMGIGYQRWNSRYTFAIAGFTHDITNATRGSGVISRGAWRPDLGGGSLLHLGLNVSRQAPDGDRLRRRARAGTHQDSHRIVDTGAITDVDSFSKLGLEAAYVRNRFSLQGEYMRERINRFGNAAQAGDLAFTGYYATASWFLTQDTRPYSSSSATLGTVRPAADSGAWEIAARFANLNLNDGFVTGGEVDTLSLALNYYMTDKLRLQLNYVMADGDTAAGGDSPEALQFRLRFTF